MILDQSASDAIAIAGITSNLKDPSAAVVSYVLLDALTNKAALYVRDNVIYDRLGQVVGSIGSDGVLSSRKKTVVASADGAITVQDSVVIITKGTAAVLTLAAPTATTQDGISIDFVSSTAAAHTVTHTPGFGGGTTARDVATFGGAINDGFSIVAYQGVWYLKGAPRNVTIA